MLDNRNRLCHEFWNYGSSNHPRETNVSLRARCWQVWLNGGQGLLPWSAVQGIKAWEQADDLTVFYGGKEFGKNEPFGSLRLKGYRRGQRDIEYLVMLAGKAGWDRDAISHVVGATLALKSDLNQMTAEVADPRATDRIFVISCGTSCQEVKNCGTNFH